jgi:hypothetical protein
VNVERVNSNNLTPAQLAGMSQDYTDGALLSSIQSVATDGITAASVAASALNGKGDWNVGKTGYALTAGTGLGNQTANITGRSRLPYTRSRAWAKLSMEGRSTGDGPRLSFAEPSRTVAPSLPVSPESPPPRRRLTPPACAPRSSSGLPG